MQLGNSIMGFYYRQDPRSWLTVSEAVKATLAVDDSLGVEVWGAKALDQLSVEGGELVDMIETCRDAEFTTVHIQEQYWLWNPVTLRREIDFAHHLGAKTLVLHPGCFGLIVEDDRPDWPEIVRIAQYAAKFGVQLAMENLKNCIWILDRILDEIGDDPEETNLGICIDIGHANLSEDAGRHPVTNYLERYAGQLIHLHLHDNQGTSDDHLLPGEGTVDWASVREVLERLDYSGPAVFETRQQGLSPIENLSRALTYYREAGY